jgi:hypothetical protein
LTLNFLSFLLLLQKKKFAASERKFNEDFLGFEIELNLSLLRFYALNVIRLSFIKCFLESTIEC